MGGCLRKEGVGLESLYELCLIVITAILFIMITVIFMINPIIKASVIELKRCNAMLLFQLQVLLDEHHKAKFTKNLILNH